MAAHVCLLESSKIVELYPTVHRCLSKKEKILISTMRPGVGRPGFESLLRYSVQAEASLFLCSEPLSYSYDVRLLSTAWQSWLVDSSGRPNAHNTPPAAWMDRKNGPLHHVTTFVFIQVGRRTTMSTQPPMLSLPWAAFLTPASALGAAHSH